MLPRYMIVSPKEENKIYSDSSKKKVFEHKTNGSNSEDFGLSEEDRLNMFQFDIEYEIYELIKRYMIKINLIYGIVEIQNI